MFFQLKNWSNIASTGYSHPLIFERCAAPVHIQKDRRHPRQNDPFLEEFLRTCDLSGRRIKLHQKERRRFLKSEIKAREGIKFNIGEYILGRNYMERQLEKWIDSQLSEVSYPIMSKPEIRTIPARDFNFRYDEEAHAYYLEEKEEALLLDISERSDIILLGHGDDALRSPFSDDKVCVMRATNTFNYRPPTPTTLTDLHVRRRVRHFDMLIGSKTDLAELEYRICYTEMKADR